jgi:hypothetical protein
LVVRKPRSNRTLLLLLVLHSAMEKRSGMRLINRYDDEFIER